MKTVRPQYHFRRTDEGLWAWDVQRLIELSKNLSVRMVNATEFPELDENHWYFHGTVSPTCRSILEHLRLIEECDLSHPIILDKNGRVMDGMHRICKAVINGIDKIPAVQFMEDPEPGYINCGPGGLPYFDLHELIERLTGWSQNRPGVCALGIVGSYARGTAKADSDLDVVVVCEEPASLLDEQSWLREFGRCESIEVETYGIVTSIFAYYDWGLEIEFGIAPRGWTDIPVDSGTARVIRDGMIICYDPEDLLARVVQAVAGR
jgi:predicted nucleotidyltransferase